MKEFGLTLRVYDGRSFADPTQTLGQVRKKKGSGKALSVAKNMKVGNLEDKFEEEVAIIRPLIKAPCNVRRRSAKF